MTEQRRFRWLGAFLVYLLIGMVLLYQYNGSFSENETRLFVELMLCYAWTGGLILYAVLFLGLYLFEPLTFISVIYELIFVVKPIVDLRARKMMEHGIDTFPGGEKATLLFALGYTALYLAYYVRLRRKERVPVLPKAEPKADNVLLYAMWAVVFALALIGLSSQGLSLRYIFTLGSGGERITDSDNVGLLFLTNFGVTLVSCWMMVMVRTQRRLPKILITLVTIIYLLMRNARWLMLVFIAAPVVYHYTKRRSQPRWIVVFLIGAVGLLVFAWMQVNRAVLHAGGAMQGWGEAGLTLETLLAPFESDLNTYRAFYAAVQRFPAKFSYLYGSTFLYTFVLFIPRVIWPGKPDNPVRLVIERSLNARARRSGTAMANIGEFYVNFGWIGVLVGMALLGFAARWLQERFLQRRTLNRNERMAYSILYPLLFQWCARGNFCGNFYMTIFAMLPFLLLSLRKRAGAQPFSDAPGAMDLKGSRS